MPNNLNIPHIEYLRVQNYRALQNLELNSLSPLTVFVGPNGSGKSTIFDVFAFLSECFSVGLRKAWDRRGRFKELRSRGQGGPIQFEFKYRESRNLPPITYHLSIDEKRTSGPYIAEELAAVAAAANNWPTLSLFDFQNGKGG